MSDRRLREATYFLGTIIGCGGLGATLFLFMIPLVWFWAMLAAMLSGFAFCLWLFRDRVWGRSIYINRWLYKCPDDVLIRFCAQPKLPKVITCGVQVLDVDPEPRPTTYEESFKNAYELWVQHDRCFDVDVKVMSHSDSQTTGVEQ